ncbi:MAG: M23 family metallopeptidase [Christensenellaceae bacterium]
MKKALCILSVLLILFCFCSCTMQAVAVPSPAPSVSASQNIDSVFSQEIEHTKAPSPTQDELTAAFFSAEFPSIPTYPKEQNKKEYDLITQNPEITQSICDGFSMWIKNGTAAVSDLYKSYDKTAQIKQSITLPSWQVLSTAAASYGVQSLKNCVDVNIHVAQNEPAVLITITPVDETTLFYTLQNPQSSIPAPLFTAIYLKTFFDDALQPNELENPPVLKEELTFPLPKKYIFDDTWGNSRDGGARRHAGTDINAPEGTPLLACANGTILDVGSGVGTGNYVVLVGKDGTQYHYYHMVEPSVWVCAGDEVVRGDIIGNVGNTGNSTANHLHFTIVAPEGIYLNPFPYLENAQVFLKDQKTS